MSTRFPFCARIAALLAVATAAPSAAPAAVFHDRQEALRLAFPGAETVEPHDVLLTDDQAAEVRRLSGVEPPSRIVTAWVGRAGGRVLGWAFLDTHGVRTLPETLMLVVAPDGTVAQTRLLAFHEPPEYMPRASWLARLHGVVLDADLRIGRRVDAISGATLSAQAATAATRRLLAVWRVAFAPDPLP